MLFITIDIGVKNLCYYICSNKVNKTIIFDLTMGDKDDKDLLIKKIQTSLLFVLSLKDEEELIVGIERQLKIAETNRFIESCIMTLLSINNIKWKSIEPNQKYNELKDKLGLTKVTNKKSLLVKHVEIKGTVIKYHLTDDHQFEEVKIMKFDDVIDCQLLYQVLVKSSL